MLRVVCDTFYNFYGRLKPTRNLVLNIFCSSPIILLRSLGKSFQTKLLASDGAAYGYFGLCVAIDGETEVIGAYGDQVGANTYQGSAYIFTRSASVWSQQAQLTASDGAASDYLGYGVSISGDYVIAGAFYADVAAIVNQGAAYVYYRVGSVWNQQSKLVASDGATTDYFSRAVSISGSYAVIGAYGDDVGAYSDQGSAYVFVRSGSVWSQQVKLTASDGAAADYFGMSVSISGDYAIIGAYYDDVGENTSQGSAYVFFRVGTTWSQQAHLIATGGLINSLFGISASLSGTTAVIGAYGMQIGPNTYQGSAYVFVRSGTLWSQQAQLVAVDGMAGDYFGYSVAISGEYIVAGAYYADDGENTNVGAAFMYYRTGTSWNLQSKLVASDGLIYDYFGRSVSISGDDMICGAYGDDIGVVTSQGSAYMYRRSASSWSFACPIGTFINYAECYQCYPGKYNDQIAQTGCVDCGIGTANPSTGSSSASDCVLCVPGKYAMTGYSDCTNCPPGKYTAAFGSSSCLLCQVDTFQPSSGQSACSDCGYQTCTHGLIGQMSCELCDDIYDLTIVSGCVDDIAAGTTFDCPTAGGVEITISGVGWELPTVSDAVVTVAGLSCPVASVSNNNTAVCVLPPNIGSNLEVILTDNKGFFGKADRLSYASPTTTAVHGCDDSEALPDVDGTSACYRDGTDEVTLTGSNFGPDQASVLIGGVKAVIVPLVDRGLSGWEQTMTIVQVPAGSGLSVGVNVLQKGGELSDGVRLLSYKSCGAGYYNSKNDSTGLFECVLCQEGTYNSEEEVFSCLSCPEGFYCEAGSDPLSCNDLLAGSSSDALSGGFDNCSCPIGYLAAESSCLKCDPGMVCNLPGVELETVDLRFGYWRESSTDSYARECLHEAACMGSSDISNQCVDGHSGPLCAVCEDGYTSANSNSACEKCFEGGHAAAFSFVIIILLLCLVCTLAISRTGSKSINAASLQLKNFATDRDIRVRFRILLAYFQIIGSFQSVLSATLPSNYTNFLTICQMASLSFGSIFSPRCFNPSFNFYDELLARTLGPIFIGIIILLIFAIASLLSPSNREKAKASFLSRIFLSCFIFFPSASTAVFQMFNCDDDFESGSSYLKADYRLECDRSEYERYLGYASLMILIYPIGIPLFYLVVLISKRRLIVDAFSVARHDKEMTIHGESDPDQTDVSLMLSDFHKVSVLRMGSTMNQKSVDKLTQEVMGRLAIERASVDPATAPYASLFGAYKPEYWYWECVECVRRLSLTGLLVFIYPGTEKQVLIAMILCMVFIVVYSCLLPYSNSAHSSFMVMSQWGTLFQLFGIYLIINQAFRAHANVLGGASIAVGLLFIALTLMSVMRRAINL